MDMTALEFEQVVLEAMDAIPEEFRDYLDNVAILVEADPSEELLDALHVPWRSSLYGLYSGSAHPHRATDPPGPPARITVFRNPHLRACGDLEHLRRQVARTLIHEVAHHFGIGEARLRELGWG
jgi:predicted Zn-dependent protease with MMP-like domain